MRSTNSFTAPIRTAYKKAAATPDEHDERGGRDVLRVTAGARSRDNA